MLRTTRKANGEVGFKVSGQLDAESVAEMETHIAAETKGGSASLCLVGERYGRRHPSGTSWRG
jgi:hypothetical protein